GGRDGLDPRADAASRARRAPHARAPAARPPARRRGLPPPPPLLAPRRSRARARGGGRAGRVPLARRSLGGGGRRVPLLRARDLARAEGRRPAARVGVALDWARRVGRVLDGEDDDRVTGLVLI